MYWNNKSQRKRIFRKSQIEIGCLERTREMQYVELANPLLSKEDKNHNYVICNQTRRGTKFSKLFALTQ